MPRAQEVCAPFHWQRRCCRQLLQWPQRPQRMRDLTVPHSTATSGRVARPHNTSATQAHRRDSIGVHHAAARLAAGPSPVWHCMRVHYGSPCVGLPAPCRWWLPSAGAQHCRHVRGAGHGCPDFAICMSSP
eukprot:365679-Chlamydomonas_euryale.AAC.34